MLTCGGSKSGASAEGLQLALAQGFQPPPPLESLIDFCGQDKLFPAVTVKVFDMASRLLLYLSPPPATPNLG